MRKGDVDLHHVVTRILNPHLGRFLDIAHDPQKIIAVTKTGGLMDIVRRESARDPLFPYAAWLVLFRDGVWSKSKEEKYYYLNFESFKEEIEPLFLFYKDALRSKDEVFGRLIKPLEACFRDIDRYLKTLYFKRKVRKSRKEHKTTVMVSNGLGIPISDVEATVRCKLDEYFIPVRAHALKTGPRGHAQISLVEGDYVLILDEYDKKLPFTVPKNRKIVVKVPAKFKVGCPYCGKIFQVELSDKLSEVTCGNLDCNTKWHEGIFHVLLGLVISVSRSELGRFGGAKWSVRLKTSQGRDSVKFESRGRLTINRKDVLTASCRKTSRGIFRKRWTGKWDVTPKMLVNNTTGRKFII